MDESCRIGMGMSTAPPPPPRRSVKDTASCRRKPTSDGHLNPEDFNDVFGGPPRTILSRQFATGFQRSPSSSTSYFYKEIFRPPEKSAPPVGRSGRSLPEFRIPGQRDNDFYNDIFGWDDHERVVRSRSRSKASSSSVLSSEELSPLRPAVSVHGYDDVSCFASELRPINIRSGWASRKMAHEEYLQRQQNIMPPFEFTQRFYNTERSCPDNFKGYASGLSRRNTSLETISLEPVSNGSFRISEVDLELESPSSPVSSVFQSSEQDRKMEVQDAMDDEEEDEAMSSYVIEINSDNREGTCESNCVDEAIAWAKEKYQPQYAESKQECETRNRAEEMLDGHHVSDPGFTDSFESLEKQHDKWVAEEETGNSEYTVQIEMQIPDEEIRLWSAGKHADIRLLLASLHHILWPNSGWLAVRLTDLTEVSRVKKAYQKAQLCLHPDKLQQRGATVQQKYIAEKAFSVLQDAWAAFVAQGAS